MKMMITEKNNKKRITYSYHGVTDPSNSEFQVQWADNEGKCGVCGDSYSEKRPRKHETGSIFDRNVTVRTYAPGEDVVLVVDVVANHLGEFSLSLTIVMRSIEAKQKNTRKSSERRVSFASGVRAE